MDAVGRAGRPAPAGQDGPAVPRAGRAARLPRDTRRRVQHPGGQRVHRGARQRGCARRQAQRRRPAQPGAHRPADHRSGERRPHGAGAPGRAGGGQVGHAPADAGPGGAGGGAGAAAGLARRWRAAAARRRAALLRGQPPAGNGRVAVGGRVPCRPVPGRAEPGHRRADRPRGRALALAGLGHRAGARAQPPGYPAGRRPAGQRACWRPGWAPRRSRSASGRWRPGPGAEGHDHPGTIAARADLGQALLVRRAARGRDHRAGGGPGRRRHGPAPDGIDPLALQGTLSAAYAGERPVRRRHPARPAHAGRPGTAAGKRPSRHDGRPGATWPASAWRRAGRRTPSPTASAPWRTGNGCWAPTTRTPSPR